MDAMVTRSLDKKAFCRGCWYPLTEINSGCCPECGRLFDLTKNWTVRDLPRQATWLRRSRRLALRIAMWLTLSVIYFAAILVWSPKKILMFLCLFVGIAWACMAAFARRLQSRAQRLRVRRGKRPRHLAPAWAVRIVAIALTAGAFYLFWFLATDP